MYLVDWHKGKLCWLYGELLVCESGFVQSDSWEVAQSEVTNELVISLESGKIEWCDDMNSLILVLTIIHQLISRWLVWRSWRSWTIFSFLFWFLIWMFWWCGHCLVFIFPWWWLKSNSWLFRSLSILWYSFLIGCRKQLIVSSSLFWWCSLIFNIHFEFEFLGS